MAARFVCALALLGGAASLSDRSQFHLFIAEHGKSYNATEHEYRFGVFQHNLRVAEKLNAARVDDDDATFGVTPFSDLTKDEFKIMYLNYQPPAAPSGTAVYQTKSNDDPPSDLDWRTKQDGVVSDVKNQGQCGSCWAFSTTEQIESEYVLAGNDPIKFAPQQIVSCDRTDLGCNGGNTETAYDYVKRAGGLATEDSYPYKSGVTGASGVCKSFDVAGGAVSDFTHVVDECRSGLCNNQDEDKFAAAVAEHGPASICVNAESWQTYVTGTMTDAQCGSHSAAALDHCVQLTGYTGYTGSAKDCGTGTDKCVWAVRNSWGRTWGKEGYILLQMGKNTCGVANDATFATVA